MNFHELYKIISKEFYESGEFKRYGYELNYETIKKFRPKIEEVVNELLNQSIQALPRLDIKTTFILRKHYGVLDDGKHQTLKSIGEDIEITPERIRQLLTKGKRFLFLEILRPKKDEKMKKPSSLEVSLEYDKLKNKTIGELRLSPRLFMRLSRNGIVTINDLLTFSKTDLQNYRVCCFKISGNAITEIEDSLEKMNLKFIDDLTKEEKEKLISSLSSENKMMLSASFINSNAKLDIFRNKEKYGNHSLVTIGEVLEFVNSTDFIIDSGVLTDLTDLGFNVSVNKRLDHILMDKPDLQSRIETIAEQNYPLDVLKTIKVKTLGLNNPTAKRLICYGHKTIGDVLKLNSQDLSKIRSLGSKGIADITNSIHGLGLCFSDEVDLLSAYSTAISEQLDGERTSSSPSKVLK